MSTSHYSNTNYEPKPETLHAVVHDWQDPLSHPSLRHSRPECTDIGANTIRLGDRVPANTRRRSPLVAAVALMFMGVGLLVLDGCALVHFADETFEAFVIAMVTAPTAVFVIATAFVVRGLRR